MLAHNATVYDIPFDPMVLFDPPAREYVTWFALLVDEVGKTRARQHAEAKAAAGRAD